jgi:hypothetical protein
MVRPLLKFRSFAIAPGSAHPHTFSVWLAQTVNESDVPCRSAQWSALDQFTYCRKSYRLVGEPVSQAKVRPPRPQVSVIRCRWLCVALAGLNGFLFLALPWPEIQTSSAMGSPWGMRGTGRPLVSGTISR